MQQVRQIKNSEENKTQKVKITIKFVSSIVNFTSNMSDAIYNAKMLQT